jgi:hypothetical protein
VIGKRDQRAFERLVFLKERLASLRGSELARRVELLIEFRKALLEELNGRELGQGDSSTIGGR